MKTIQYESVEDDELIVGFLSDIRLKSLKNTNASDWSTSTKRDEGNNIKGKIINNMAHYYIKRKNTWFKVIIK